MKTAPYKWPWAVQLVKEENEENIRVASFLFNYHRTPHITNAEFLLGRLPQIILGETRLTTESQVHTIYLKPEKDTLNWRLRFSVCDLPAKKESTSDLDGQVSKLVVLEDDHICACTGISIEPDLAIPDPSP